MGMFGLRFDPNGPKGADRLALLGATLRDVGSGLRGEQGDALAKAQEAMAESQQIAGRNAFAAMLQSKLGPQYQNGPQAQVTLGTAPRPGMFGSAGDPAPTQAPEFHYQAPQRTSDGLTIDSPELAGLVTDAQKFGNGKARFDMSGLLDVLKAQQPDMAVAADGSTYNRHSGNLPSRFATPTTINGWNVDAGAPDAQGKYFPKLPDGMQPNGSGGVDNITGLTTAMGAQEEATTLGKTRGTMFGNVPTSSGRPAMMTGAQYLGGNGAAGAQQQGFGVGQSPDDAAYAADIAKASAGQYNGLLAAGQKAGGSIASFGRMSQLLEGLNTGRLTPAGLEVQKAFASFGITPNPAWSKVEAADALSNKLVLDATGGSLGTGFSNADRDFMKSMNPSIMNTPQGRQTIIAFGVARAKRDQQVAQMARQWTQRAGRIDKPDRSGKTFFDYLDAYAEANPLMKP